MDRAQAHQVRERYRGLRRVRHVTAWTAAGASALAMLFGGIFAANGSAAGSATADPGASSGEVPTVSPGSTTDPLPSPEAGSTLDPPDAPPTMAPPTTETHAHSGGS